MNSRCWMVWVVGVVAAAAAGCAPGPSTPSTTLTREQFATLYDDEHTVTDVYYMGTDPKFHHFCMEHWTFKSDGTSANLDVRKFYQVSVDELGVKHPFVLTYNENQWRLMRPHEPVKPEKAGQSF